MSGKKNKGENEGRIWRAADSFASGDEAGFWDDDTIHAYDESSESADAPKGPVKSEAFPEDSLFGPSDETYTGDDSVASGDDLDFFASEPPTEEAPLADGEGSPKNESIEESGNPLTSAAPPLLEGAAQETAPSSDALTSEGSEDVFPFDSDDDAPDPSFTEGELNLLAEPAEGTTTAPEPLPATEVEPTPVTEVEPTPVAEVEPAVRSEIASNAEEAAFFADSMVLPEPVNRTAPPSSTVPMATDEELPEAWLPEDDEPEMGALDHGGRF